MLVNPGGHGMNRGRIIFAQWPDHLVAVLRNIADPQPTKNAGHRENERSAAA
jgi:hypothetical protein